MKKKHIALLIVMISFASIIKAQDFRAGVLGGGVFSQIDGDNYSGFNKAGIALGVYASRQINEHWLAQFEINYMQKGAQKRPHQASGD